MKLGNAGTVLPVIVIVIVGFSSLMHAQSVPSSHVAAIGVTRGVPVLRQVAGARAAAASTDPVSYDEQIGETFTQDFTSMAFNVTAVEQSDPSSGDGPAYLLNGLSSTGYWYQVGLSWNWDPGYHPGSGFDMLYEVWDASGNSIYPASGGGGMRAFSGPVNSGDNVLLNLYFSATYGVVLLVKDLSTGALASVTYSAEGATDFIGEPSATANSNGYFTGLMTEWYHSSPFRGNVSPVVYSNPDFPIASAWMWVDEFSCSDLSCDNSSILFDDSTSGPVAFSNSTQLHEFSSNGATLFGSAYELVTGPAYVTLSVGYGLSGSGSGYGVPVFNFTYNGAAHTAVLTNKSTSYVVDALSLWSVTAVLSGSSQTERWALVGLPSAGTASSSQTMSFTYKHQYHLTVFGGGGTLDGWFSPGKAVSITEWGVFSRSGGSGQRIMSYSIDGSVTDVPPTSGAVQVVVLMSGPQTVTFSSVDQFRVSLDSATTNALGSITPPTISGDNYWYDRGSQVTVVLNGIWGRNGGTGDRLVSYSIDGGQQSPVGATGTLSIVVTAAISSPESIASVMVQQFQLSTPTGSVASETNPTIVGDSGWYDSGTSATVVYNTHWNETARGSRTVALDYRVNQGAASPVDPSSQTFSLSLAVDNPTRVMVDSTTQYLVTFAFLDEAGAKVVAPSGFQISTGGVTIDGAGPGFWIDKGANFTVVRVEYEGRNVAEPSVATAVFNSTLYRLKTLVYDAGIRVTDSLGIPVGGTQVKMVLSNGTVVVGMTDGTGAFVAPGIPLGNFTASVAGVAGSVEVAGDASVENPTQVRVLLSVTLFILLVAVSAALVATFALLLRRRSKEVVLTTGSSESG